MNLKFETKISRSVEEIKAGFDRKLFEALRPPWVQLRLKRFDGCKPGDEVHLELGQFGIYNNWVSHITQQELTESYWFFIDVGHTLPWPIKNWSHKHLVKKITDNQSLIVDDIQFDCGSKILNYLVWPGLWMSFAIRPKVYKKFFEG